MGIKVLSTSPRNNQENTKLIRETVGINKSIVVMGKKEEETNNRIIRDTILN